LIPEEDRVGDHVLAILSPLSEEHGGPLKIQRVNYKEKRNNIIIEYPAAVPSSPERVVSFVGSHMDVVPANPEEWDRDPFQLTIEGDKLYGRGTTDCLGHVALVTDLMACLAEKKPKLNVSVFAVFIANEENGEITGVGVEEMVKHGKLDRLKNGPVYWIDTADKQPCIGTGAVMPRRITAHGKNGHSGFPQNAINALLLAYESIIHIMNRFHTDFPAHPLEKKYNYGSCSTMKPTQWNHPPSSLNSIPGKATIAGDIRMTPFYDLAEVKAAVERYVKELNESITVLPNRGPNFSYQLGDGSKGQITLEWISDGCLGVYCDLESDGFKVLAQATEEVLGVVKPEALTGSLPCVGELKAAGFDLQIVGYGVEAVYHGLNEYAELSAMKQGSIILGKVIEQLDAKAAHK